MTTSSVTPRVKYNGSGSAGPFSIPFVWTDLVVVKTSSAGVETTLTSPTNYTATGSGTDTGSLTLVVALAVGETLTIERTTPATQTLDLTRSYIDYDLIEAAFDKLTRQAQDLLYQVGRTLRLYKDDTTGSGAYNAGNQKISNLADGVADQDAATIKQLGDVVGASDDAVAAAAAAAASAAQAAQSAQEIQDVVAGSVSSFEGRVGAVVSSPGDYTASEIVNVPSGNLAAIDVQSALNELQTDINNRQPTDALLTAISDLTTSADKYIYTTGTDTVALGTITSFARSLLDDTGTAQAQATLGLTPGVNVQAYAAELSTVAGEVTAYSHTLIAANSASAARSVLGLGTVATTDASAYQPSDATLSSLAAYNTNGILTQTAADTFVGRTVTAGDGVTVTNGNGVSGNPTIAVDINGLTNRPSFASGDKLMIYKSGVGLRKIDYDDLPVSGGTSGLANAYKDITDGTTTSSASGADIFKLRASTGVTVTVASNDATHGDNALIGLNTPLTALAGTTAAADKVPYFSSGSAASTATLTSFGRDVISGADASAVRTTLGLVPGVDIQAYDAQLADVAGLTPSNGVFIVGNGTNFTAQSGATARTTLGVGSTDAPFFDAVNVGHASDTTISRSSAGVIAIEGQIVPLNNITNTHTAGSIELGHATDTTITRDSAGVIAVEGVTVPLNSTSSVHTASSIELGHASDTTITRSSAGVIAVEGFTVPLNSTLNTHTANTIELGHASDTTISRSSAGVIAVEGVTVPLNSTTSVYTAGSIELGHATDTTLSRSSAGVLAVEGKNVYMAGGTDVAVADGGTGASTFTANAVLLGNGTSAFQTVAPGANGQVLTSNGTTWTSAAAPSGGVTSLAAGNGITVSASTGAVTVSQDIYTGSSSTNTSYPIGTYLLSTLNSNSPATAINSSVTLYVSSPYVQSSGSALTGTWRTRGYCVAPGTLIQRTA